MPHDYLVERGCAAPATFTLVNPLPIPTLASSLEAVNKRRFHSEEACEVIDDGYFLTAIPAFGAPPPRPSTLSNLANAVPGVAHRPMKRGHRRRRT
jgi:hypothetical protein